MELFSNMVNLQLMLFLLILIGIAARKTGIITVQSRKSLSGLLINIILPCNIINSFLNGVSFSDQFLKNCLLSILLSFLIQIFITFMSKFLFRKYAADEKAVLSYGMICSNSSFIGLPVSETLYGNTGVMYTSIYQIPIRFFMWTAGLSLFTNINKKDTIQKLMTHPCIVSIFIGLLLMFLPFHLPAFMLNTISTVSKCNIPVSMFVIGSILADTHIKTLFSKSVIYFSMLRLIVFPLFIYVVLLPFHLDPLLTGICVLMTAMPAGNTTSILADQYSGNSMLASQITFVSTVLSIITIPLLSLLI